LAATPQGEKIAIVPRGIQPPDDCDRALRVQDTTIFDNFSPRDARGGTSFQPTEKTVYMHPKEQAGELRDKAAKKIEDMRGKRRENK
jgi:hypothetical protein